MFPETVFPEQEIVLYNGTFNEEIYDHYRSFFESGERTKEGCYVQSIDVEYALVKELDEDRLKVIGIKFDL